MSCKSASSSAGSRLAARASKGKRAKATDMLANERLLLLEEGHCLRDQALSW